MKPTEYPRAPFWANHDYAWFILTASFFLVFISYGFRMSFGVYLKPMASEFAWDRSSISIAASFNSLLYGLFQPFMGKLLDKYGAKKVISLSAVVLSGSTAALSTVNDLFTLYLIFGFIMAFSLAGCSMVTNAALISKWFIKKRGLALGLLGAGASVGQLMMVPTITYLIMIGGWRFSFLVIGAAMLALMLPLAVLVLKDEPGRPMAAISSKPSVAVLTGGNPMGAPWADDSLPLHSVFRTAPFWLLAGGFFVCGFTVNLVSTHLPAFVTDIGYSPMMAGNLLALTGALNVVGTITMGGVSDRFGSRKPLALVYFLRGFSIALLLVSHNPIFLYSFAIIVGFSWFATSPLVTALCADNFGTRNIGTIFGTIFLSHQIGGALSSYLGGLIYDIRGGYDLAFAIAVALAMLASLLSLFIGQSQRLVPIRQLGGAKALG